MSAFVDSRFRERISPAAFKAGTKIGEILIAKDGRVDQDYLRLNGPYTTYYLLSGSPLKLVRTWDQVNPGPPYRDGGPFLSCKVENNDLLIQGRGEYLSRPSQGPPGYIYRGGFSNPTFQGDATSFSQYYNIGLPGDLLNSVLIPEIAGLGPEAYRRLRPQIEIAGMGQFLGEIRDTPRMLKTTAKGFHDSWQNFIGIHKDLSKAYRRQIMGAASKELPKDVSDQFINSQFGWVPFVNDLIKFDMVVQDSQKYVERITAKNGQWDKRVTVLEETGTETSLYESGGMGVWPVGSLIGGVFSAVGGVQDPPRFQTIREEIRRVWASGQFKYYRPEFDSGLSGYNSTWSSVQRDLMLLGARINPSVLYKITPWSWLADWFTNLGTNIDNASARAFDGSLSRNLFLMASVSRRVKFNQFLPLHSGHKTVTFYRTVSSKQRVEGGPYGLGWASSTLTARQGAILAALGLTRAL